MLYATPQPYSRPMMNQQITTLSQSSRYSGCGGSHRERERERTSRRRLVNVCCVILFCVLVFIFLNELK